MSIMAVLYAEFKRLEEELQHPDKRKNWNAAKYQYFSLLKKIFRH